MFKWQYSLSVDTEATSKQVWSVWKDAASWPRWDTQLEWVKLDGDFVEGTKGTMKPSEGPIVKFELTNIEEDSQFVDCAKLPLTQLKFTHRYESSIDGNAKITHTIEMQGILAPLFGRIIGSKVRAHLLESMLNLSKIATTMN